MPDDSIDIPALSTATINAGCRVFRSTSLFYSLYYINEIMGEDEAAYDFMKVSEELAQGFLGYGIISMLGEMRHFQGSYIYKGDRVRALEDDEYEQFLNDHIEEEHREFARMARDYQAMIRRTPQSEQEQVEQYFKDMEKRLHILSEMDKRLDDMEYLFSLGQREVSSGELMVAEETGWPLHFGGDGWANVARHLKRRKEYPRTMWVDQSFAIEHNNGNWFGKMSVLPEEFENFRETFSGPEEDKIFISGSMDDWRSILRHGVRWLLDQNHKENMEPIFKMALNYNDEVNINLRDYMRRL